MTSSFPAKSQVKYATHIAEELYKGYDHITKLGKVPIVGAIGVTNNAPVMLAATNKLVDRNRVDAAGVKPHEATFALHCPWMRPAPLLISLQNLGGLAHHRRHRSHGNESGGVLQKKSERRWCPGG